MKITRPSQVALFTSLACGLGIGIACFFISWATGELRPILSLILLLVGFLISYFFSYIFIERFLYGRIKLIYKNILQLKAQKSNDLKISMNEDVLGAVSDNVQSWASNKSEEIKKLREQEQFRKEFIGNLAHELKTPIFSIQGYILTLLEGGIEDEKVNRDFLERAAKGVDRMTAIVEDLDTIMKIESNRMSLDVKKHNILDLSKDIIESLEYRSEEKNIKIKFKENYDSPIMVQCDKGRIQQVMTNLLSNAIYYSEEGGEIEIRFYKMDKNLLVEVSDNGIGIDSEHLSRLFERFYRVDKSRSRHQGGTGLGLAIVKHIVEAHGQTIDVRSTPDVGSTFSFTLALA